MQYKSLHAILTQVTTQANHQEAAAELLPQEQASQLKSGTAPAQAPSYAPSGAGLWRTLAPWLTRLDKALGRTEQLADGSFTGTGPR